MKATPFLALYSFILIWLYVKEQNYALFLIWMQTPIYWAHEFEEYICPGGFLQFFNRNPLGSVKEDYPMTRGAFWINIPLVYILLPLSGIVAHFFGIGWGLWTAYFSALNALAHVGMFFIFGCKYNPGLVASVLLNIPFGIYTVWYFLSHHLVSTGVNATSIHCPGFDDDLRIRGARPQKQARRAAGEIINNNRLNRLFGLLLY